MKLWVDDERPAPAGWTPATTVEDAIEYLICFTIEELSLDHDLGGDRTGYEVLTTLERCLHEDGMDFIPHTIHIHSANPVGRQRLELARAALLRAKSEQAGGSKTEQAGDSSDLTQR